MQLPAAGGGREIRNTSLLCFERGKRRTVIYKYTVGYLLFPSFEHPEGTPLRTASSRLLMSLLSCSRLPLAILCLPSYRWNNLNTCVPSYLLWTQTPAFRRYSSGLLRPPSHHYYSPHWGGGTARSPGYLQALPCRRPHCWRWRPITDHNQRGESSLLSTAQHDAEPWQRQIQGPGTGLQGSQRGGLSQAGV